MGASAKARAAKKSAANQYYKVFSELKEADAPQRIFSNNKKQVEEELGDNISYSSKRMAMQMDKSAKAINNDVKYKEHLQKYNDRYAALKKQLAGQSVTRYSVGDEPVPEPVKQSGFNGIGGGNNFIGGNGGNGGTSGMASIGALPVKVGDTTRYYSSKEEALADAKANMDKYNTSRQGLLGTVKPFNGSFGVRGNYTDKDIAAMKVTDPNRMIKTSTLNGITVGYRQLDDMESAYKDLNALSKKAAASPVNQYAKQYEAVGARLRGKLKREDGVIDSSKGLLAQDLAGADLNNGVIK